MVAFSLMSDAPARTNRARVEAMLEAYLELARRDRTEARAQSDPEDRTPRPSPPDRDDDALEPGRDGRDPATPPGPHAYAHADTGQWLGGRVSYLMVNAQSLMHSKNGAKCADLENLLERYRWPSLVFVSEVDGVNGKLDVADRLGPAIRRSYGIQWSLRSSSLSDGPLDGRRKVGGGIALLVHRRLQVTVRDMSLPVPQSDEHWLDGHVRWWKLVPLPTKQTMPAHRFALQRPVAVTCAYVPPSGDAWGHRVRDIAFSTMQAIDQQIQDSRLHEDLYAVTLEHSNHPDGGVDLPVDYAEWATTGELRTVLEQAQREQRRPKRQVGTLRLDEQGSLTLCRMKSPRRHRRSRRRHTSVQGYVRESCTPSKPPAWANSPQRA